MKNLAAYLGVFISIFAAGTNTVAARVYADKELYSEARVSNVIAGF